MLAAGQLTDEAILKAGLQGKYILGKVNYDKLNEQITYSNKNCWVSKIDRNKLRNCGMPSIFSRNFSAAFGNDDDDEERKKNYYTYSTPSKVLRRFSEISD